MSHYMPYVIVTIVLALIILVRATVDMIIKRKCQFFMPFFIFGLALCLSAGFMFYGFFGIALDVYLAIKLVAVFGIFFMLWRKI